MFKRAILLFAALMVPAQLHADIPVMLDMAAQEDWTFDGRHIPAPETLEQAVETARELLDDGMPRTELSRWLVKVVDRRVTNMNTPERLTDFRNLNPFDALRGQREFDEWRDSNLNQYTETANWAWEHQLGNCEENAGIVYYVLKKAGMGDDVRIMYAGENHTFVVWGMEEGANQADPLSWGEDAIVVDPWYGSAITDMSVIVSDYWFGQDGEALIADRTENHDKDSIVWAERGEASDIDCFVVTAVSGSPHSGEVKILRAYRDRVLRKSPAGAGFIAWYEKWGPVMAFWLRKHPSSMPAARDWIVVPAAAQARDELAKLEGEPS